MILFYFCWFVLVVVCVAHCFSSSGVLLFFEFGEKSL